jgi:hypothetical protein
MVTIMVIKATEMGVISGISSSQSNQSKAKHEYRGEFGSKCNISF